MKVSEEPGGSGFIGFSFNVERTPFPEADAPTPTPTPGNTGFTSLVLHPGSSHSSRTGLCEEEGDDGLPSKHPGGCRAEPRTEPGPKLQQMI